LDRHDSSLLQSLLDDLEAEYVLADAGYDSESYLKAVKAMGAEPVIAPNPRRGGKRRRLKRGELLKAKRYLVEQFNGLIKNHVLKGCLTKPKGITSYNVIRQFSDVPSIITAKSAGYARINSSFL